MPTKKYTHRRRPGGRPPTVRPAFIPIGPSIAYVPLTRGLFALIDSEDAERVSQHAWKVDITKTGFSVNRRLSSDGKRTGTQMLSRFLVDAGPLQVDHHNMNGLDNRKANLRKATASLNCHNKRISPLNTTGFKGVQRHYARFRPILTVAGEQMSMGLYDTAEEAHAVYCAHARIYVGEFFRDK